MGWVLFSFHLQRSYSPVVFNQCATLYLVRIFFCRPLCGIQAEKITWESRRKGVEETLCIRYDPFLSRLQ